MRSVAGLLDTLRGDCATLATPAGRAYVFAPRSARAFNTVCQVGADAARRRWLGLVVWGPAAAPLAPQCGVVSAPCNVCCAGPGTLGMPGRGLNP